MHRERLSRSVRAAVLISVASVAALAFVFATPRRASAQIHGGDFSLYQTTQLNTVGRAWCSGDHSVEYWAYVEGEYAFADSGNDSVNRWRLDAEYDSAADYADFEAFKTAILALPEMSGKTVRFQSHVVAEEVVEN